MTDEEKRQQRGELKIIRSQLESVVNALNKQIGSLCRTFSEYDLISLGWKKSNFSGPYMAYEYKKNGKYVVFLDKSGDVLSYDGSPTKFFEDVKELEEYGNS